ncbi:transposase [Aquitalea sp. LB_tupeE]|uniref:transposase n=1 Tax=Aquitalea sp. LB_tupeE TaxID=2748078 RepID=UPI003519FD0D
MTKPAPKRYRTTNWNAYNQVLIQRGSLSVWLNTIMSWQATPRGKRGRTQTYSDAAIQSDYQEPVWTAFAAVLQFHPAGFVTQIRACIRPVG